MSAGERSLQGSLLADDSLPAIKIGATVEKPLDAALWRFRTGEIGLDDLTNSLAAWYLEGHAAALATVLPELTKAEQERDQAKADAARYYELLCNPRPPIKIGPSYAELEVIRHDYDARRQA